MNLIVQTYRKIAPRWLKLLLSAIKYRIAHRFYGKLLPELLIRVGREEQAVKTNFGSITVNLKDKWVGRIIYATRCYETAETEFLKNNLNSNSVYLDVGANIGYFVCVAATRIGKDGHIIALEPDPYNHKLLLKNIQNNHASNISVFNLAAGNQAAKMKLYKSKDNYGDHRLYSSDPNTEFSEIDVVQLDQLFRTMNLPAPTLIKIDVQGYEYYVAKGLSQLFESENKLTVTTEFWPHGMRLAGTDPQDYLNLFKDRHFEPHELKDDGNLRKIGWDEIWELINKIEKRKGEWAWLNLVFCR